MTTMAGLLLGESGFLRDRRIEGREDNRGWTLTGAWSAAEGATSREEEGCRMM